MYIGSIDIKGFITILRGIFSPRLSNIKFAQASIELIEQNKGEIILRNIQDTIYNTWENWNLKSINHFGFELQPLNALSDKFEITFFDSAGKKIETQKFIKGKLTQGQIIEEINCFSLSLKFNLDASIWRQDLSKESDYISHQIRELAFLNKGIKYEVKFQTVGEDCKIIYCFQKGLNDKLKVEKLKGLGDTYFELNFEKTIKDFNIEIAFAFRKYSVDEPTIISYVNDYHTRENGTHVDGVLKGLTYGVMRYFQKNKLTNLYKISEKGMKENLILILNIRMKEPIFSGCVKNKLANSEIIEPIAKVIENHFYKMIENDETSTQRLIRKFEI